MSLERQDFRIITSDEYQELYDDPNSRIKFDELENDMVVEVYGTGPGFRNKDRAFNFTSQVEIVSPATNESMGRAALFLIAISTKRLEPLPGHKYHALAKPELVTAESPLIWSLPESYSLTIPVYGQLTHGFFGSWSNNDTSELDEITVALAEERTKTLSLL